MSIGYGPKWPFYSCYGLYWIDGIYVVRNVGSPYKGDSARFS